MTFTDLHLLVKNLAAELALEDELWTGYIGNCGPGFDDRLWMVGFKTLRYRETGTSISAITWRTGEQPEWLEIVANIRDRVEWLERNGYVDPLVDRITARNIESVTELPAPVTAKVTHEHHVDGARTYELSTGHTVQLGYGSGGDGFCYAHQSFDCIDNLSHEERAAIRRADECVQEPAAS